MPCRGLSSFISLLFSEILFQSATYFCFVTVYNPLIREDLSIKAGDKVVFLKTDDDYKITRAKDIMKEGIEIFKDVYVTVKETKEGLGKGFERICKGLYEW